MELAVLFMLALFAFIAWAPQQLTQVGLMLAWGVGSLFVLVPLGQLLWRLF